MEPLDFLRVLRQRWKIIAAALIIAGVAAWVTTPAKVESGPPVLSYTASSTLLQQPGSDMSLPYIALLASKGRIPTVAAQNVGFTDDPALLASQVSIAPDTEVGTLTFTVNDQDGEQAAKIANAFSEATIKVLAEDSTKQRKDQINELNDQIVAAGVSGAQAAKELKGDPDNVLLKARVQAYDQQVQLATQQLISLLASVGDSGDLSVLQEATPLPVVSGGGFQAPSSRKGRLLLGLGVGLALGLLLVLLMDRLDTKLRRREDVEVAYRLPVVAEIPKMSRSWRKRAAIDALHNPAGPLAESYRSLRTSLALLPSRPVATSSWGDPESEPGSGTVPHLPAVPQVVLVTSARAAEGKSTTAALLAATFAETGKRVLVVDADFYNPSMPKLLDVTPGPGLADLLSVDSDLQIAQLAKPTDQGKIRLLTTGDPDHYRGALPTRIAKAVNQARAYAEIVIIDAAPMLGTNEALDFVPYVDSVVVVSRLGKVTRTQASRVTDLLGRTRAPVLGVVAIGGKNKLAGYGPYRSRAEDSGNRRRRKGSKQVPTS